MKLPPQYSDDESHQQRKEVAIVFFLKGSFENYSSEYYL